MKVICDHCSWSGEDSDCVTLQARNKGTGEVTEVGVMACPACHTNTGEAGKIRFLSEGEEAPISEENLNKFFESAEHWERPLQVEATHFNWFCILGGLQLALRHPRMQGPSAGIVREIAYQIAMRMIKAIPTCDKEFVELAGWVEFGIDPDKLFKHLITPDQIDIIPQ